MRPRRFASLALLALPLIGLAGGCSYIHFGRPERFRTDAKLLAENSDLRTQRKMLQEELAIARREGSVLRAAIERPPAPNAGAEELASKLQATARELSALRASYAQLQATREKLTPAAPATDTPAGRFAAAEQIAGLRGKLGETEDKLADALRNYTRLQAENQQLQSSVTQVRAENATLALKLDEATAQNQEARSALAQLNTEFLAQKEARAQAEQAMEALRTQLHAMAAATPVEAPSLAGARESSAGGAREIESTLHAPGLSANPPANATLSVSPARLQAAARAASPAPDPAAAPATPSRTYVVQDGDTLEKIAQKFYGRPERWNLVYAANRDLLGDGRPLTPGTRLEIPEP